jgi:hydrogenase maturation protease
VNPGDGAGRWRIIGVGSPAAGDDLGAAAIAAIAAAGLNCSAELLSLDRPGPALIEHLQARTRVIVIDAMVAGLPPGTVRELSLEDLIVSARPPSSHQLGLAETLALGSAPACLPQHLYLIGIEAGAGLDGDTRSAALARVVETVRRLLDAAEPGLAGLDPRSSGASQRKP